MPVKLQVFILRKESETVFKHCNVAKKFIFSFLLKTSLNFSPIGKGSGLNPLVRVTVIVYGGERLPRMLRSVYSQKCSQRSL